MKSVAFALAAAAAVAHGDVFNVKYVTEAGDVTFEIHEDWAPLGAARFKELVEDGFYDGAAFFRYVPNFVVQWGIAAEPGQNNYTEIKDDKWGVVSNTVGTLVYATSGNDTRTTQLFVNFRNNSFLDKLGFTPFGKVTSGYDVLKDQVYSAYGEKPDQDKIYQEGEEYLAKEFPLITHIQSAWVLDDCEQ
ncbi:Aste57867_16427 [Aphanomyces stellatus]|uniref:Peptidyl-prolyl cis-trans isomerase n=1 Tax=Aphanomyces stellatus TaxID=120398 RepID=A0A485L5E9_9STRA|nr:hypothetical protein As57867_016370 [Aphanomyces stellatus]VFT93202.1 Aste57867_16427 [Aphanomyces stellatus]